MSDYRNKVRRFAKTHAEKPRRNRLGQFVLGCSGNPAGRPRDEARRQRFIDAYIASSFFGRRSAIAAGCPTRGASVAAFRMLQEPHVKAAIDAHCKARTEAFERWWQEYLDSWPNMSGIYPRPDA